MKLIRYPFSLLAISLSIFNLTGYSNANTEANQHLSYEKQFNFSLSETLPAPKGKEDGRGEPIEKLVIQYAPDYENDPYLKEDVINFRRWYWQKLYTSLDKKVQERPTYLNTYRLQAEAYFVNKEYKEALSQLDQILRQNPKDVHALAMTVLASRVLEDKAQETARFNALEQLGYPSLRYRTNLYSRDVNLWIT